MILLWLAVLSVTSLVPSALTAKIQGTGNLLMESASAKVGTTSTPPRTVWPVRVLTLSVVYVTRSPQLFLVLNVLLVTFLRVPLVWRALQT